MLLCSSLRLISSVFLTSNPLPKLDEYSDRAGGGRRCEVEGCTKCAQGKTLKCVRHGGGVRCSMDGCGKTAKGKSGLCISHGGGVRCCVATCGKAAADAKTLRCLEHGEIKYEYSKNMYFLGFIMQAFLVFLFLYLPIYLLILAFLLPSLYSPSPHVYNIRKHVCAQSRRRAALCA